MSRRTTQISEVEITYKPRPSISRETERNALCAVYRFILDCQERKKAARPGGPDDDAKEINGCAATTQHTR